MRTTPPHTDLDLRIHNDREKQISSRKITSESPEGISGDIHEFSLFLVEKGSGIQITDGITREIEDRELHFVFPEQQNHWDPDPEKEINISRISIPDSLFETFGSYLKYPFSHYMKIGRISLSEESFEKFRYEFSNIHDELSEGKESGLTAEFRLKVIMLMLSKEVYRMHYEKRMDSACLLSRFITLVFEHYREHRTIGFYADRLAVTPNYLNVLCVKHLGRTATGIISNELLSEIKQYLIVSGISIKELSILMNFNTINSFYAFFKRYTGITPKEFQDQHKNRTLPVIAEDL
jgi:AraC family transcriptional regulator, transcriptional activator of pobA